MIQLLRELWIRITGFFLPQNYFSWQTMIYLGFFSFTMSWVARLVGTLGVTESFIATAGWIFFALGIGWFLEKNKIRPFGIPLAPWVAGMIVCVYFFGLVPWGTWPIAMMTWPLVSVAIVAIPQFFTWELQPKVPTPMARQQLILLLLIALLFSSWFQFYFRLQSWFDQYPTVATDNFDNSGFVHRFATQPEGQAEGISLLTSAEVQVKGALHDTPWPYVERWLLNLNEQIVKLQVEKTNTLEDSFERDMWQITARPRSLNAGYALDLLAIWSGPASDPDGYYFEKTCVIQPVSKPQTTSAENDDDDPPPTTMAQVECDLATPKRMGKPDSAT
ncbi:MAG: DUF5357 domain-containing protein [Leptolyngbya sp. SIO1D8]|nr:DUF5357 domain-containing protein [Leptolyngbya sp. SIO1D8]